MRKFTLLVCSLAAVFAFAQFTGPGYYRVHNVGSDRYISIKGTAFNNTTNPDAFWPCILMQTDSAQISDPGSIIYIPNMGQASLYAEGVSTYSLTGLMLEIVMDTVTVEDQPVYLAKTKYKSFPCIFRDYGLGLTAGMLGGSPEYYWWIEPVNAESIETSFLGMQPVSNEVADADGWYWATICVDFPILLPVDGGVEGAYTVTDITMGIDSLYYAEPIKVYGQGDTIPATVPVLLKCAAAYPSGNKIIPVGDIANNTALPLKNDLLMGNYFSTFYNHSSFANPDQYGEYISAVASPAVPEYLELGVDEDGRMVFCPKEASEAANAYMDANTAWLDITGLDLKDVTTIYLGQAPVEPEIVRGDASGDGILNVKDVSCVVNYLLVAGSEESEKAEINIEAADFDGDGRLSVRDVSLIINELLMEEE